MSDLGAEILISNFADVSKQWFTRQAVDEESVRAGFLFPRSIAFTRTLHIIDWTLQSILERLPWYAPWQASYKDVCEFLCEAHYRDALSSSLQHLELSPEDAHAHIKILCHFGSISRKTRGSNG